MVPTGLNGNIWKHGFPQDMYYVTENLARLGHVERAEAQMPNWLDNLDAVKRYTRRIADREGAGVEVRLDSVRRLRLVPEGLRTSGWRKLQIGRAEIVLPPKLTAGTTLDLAYEIRPLSR